MKTMAPIALIRGLTWPCSSTRIFTGKVWSRPETNQAIMNSSNDTAMVINADAKMAGAAKGSTTSQMLRHWLAPRFHAASSNPLSISPSLIRVMASANGVQITTWLTNTPVKLEPNPTRLRNSKNANPRISSGMVGGSIYNRKVDLFPTKFHRRSKYAAVKPRMVDTIAAPIPTIKVF